MPVRFTQASERLLKLADVVLPQVAENGRDLARMAQGVAGQLRIAVECHTCFDWLMPAMDIFRKCWPEIELDILSGFQVLYEPKAEVAILKEIDPDQKVNYHPLFSFEIFALLAHDHPMASHNFLVAEDFFTYTLIA